MYLSRLILDLGSSAVRRDLGDCQALHRTIMSAFPESLSAGAARSAAGVLYRIEPPTRSRAVALLVQSRIAPDWSRLPEGYLAGANGHQENPACKSVGAYYDALQAGDVLTFRLRANPTKKIDTKSGADGARRNGKRVELRAEAERLAWLGRKAEQSGFELLGVQARADVPDVLTMPEDKLKGRRPRLGPGEAADSEHRLTFGAALFEGRIRIYGVAAFRRALEEGIGPGKAYGFGLLSIARPRTDQ